MGDRDPRPRAPTLIVVGGRAVVVSAGGRGDLGLVDRLLRIWLGAARMGWSVRLGDVDDDLRALIDLVGVGDRLGLRPRRRA